MCAYGNDDERCQIGLSLDSDCGLSLRLARLNVIFLVESDNIQNKNTKIRDMELSLNILHKCWFGLRRSLQKDLIQRHPIPKDALLRNSTFFVPPCPPSIFHRSFHRSHSTNTLPKQTLSREIRRFSVRYQITSDTKSNKTAKPAIVSSTTPSQKVSGHPPTDPSSTSEGLSKENPTEKVFPAYELTVTCRPCGDRSVHRISQQGYHHGTVMITCPSCKNRHVISDHLKVSKLCTHAA